MTRYLWAILLCCCAGAARGAPEFRPELATLPAVPRHAPAAGAVQQALEQAPPSDRPYRFAVGVPLTLSASAGRWDALDRLTARWRLRLHSPGALSLSAYLPTLVLPAGAKLWVYRADGLGVQGPYDAADVGLQGFWTPVVDGDELVLEVRAPAAFAAAVRADVGRAFHGFRGWNEPQPKSAGDAGECNINVACSEGAPWSNEARSVAMITIGNQYVCSGQLLNNVRQDRRALFLTADHCGIDADAGPADSVNFYFDYEAPACNTPPIADPETVVIGSTFLADDVRSDFTLLRINGSLPPDVYFAGWNATGQSSSSGASIHHPRGDEKKISLYDTPLAQAAVDIGTACDVEAWQVQWSRGTTETGSSGGGLWNSTHQLIGVLSGGFASCDSRHGLDYFGRLDRAWTASTARDGQLKAHLDPDGTCIAAIPGLDSATTSSAPITSGPTRCEGVASSCSPGAGAGGGAPSPWLLALLLAGAWRRMR